MGKGKKYRENNGIAIAQYAINNLDAGVGVLNPRIIKS